MIDAFPLSWPVGKPRTPRHKVQHSQFSPGSRPQEVAAIEDEIRRLGGRNVVVSTNLRLRNDGLPYARDRQPDDAGCAVYFDLNGPKCFACDRWMKIEENLRAIRKSIEAIRGLERWGSKDFVDAAFTGFAALPPPHAASWRDVLGFEPGSRPSSDQIRTAFREKAHEAHPDHGGNNEYFAVVTAARDAALKEAAND